MTAAIHTRMSTHDKGQTNDKQLRELQTFAERPGYTVA
jgi:DNA invertase Pin-like site-specific DNA recombinase